MKPIRFKVDEIKETGGEWHIVGHALQGGTVNASPTARLAGCKAEQLPLPEGLSPETSDGRARLVFRLKNPEDHTRFTLGQKLLLDL